MSAQAEPTLLERIEKLRKRLSPKNKVLADYVLSHPRKAVFLRTRELASACGTSDATVIRFTHLLGYRGYPEFIQALRDLVDHQVTIMDRVDLIEKDALAGDKYSQVLLQEIDNLRYFYESLNPMEIDQAVQRLMKAPRIDIIGARLSYSYAYYLGWSLGKLRRQVRSHDGCNSWTIDHITQLPPASLVMMVATSRYPNVLMHLAQLCQRLGHKLLLIADSKGCPMIPYADQVLVAPFKRFPLFNSPSTLAALINCLIIGLVTKMGKELREHQEMLEQMYRENEIFFQQDRE